MRSFTANVCAAWLIALFALPFTAPFPTCDLSGFFVGSGPHDAVPAVPPIRSHSTVLEDGTYSVLPTLATESGRLKLAVVSDDPGPAIHPRVLHGVQSVQQPPAGRQAAEARPSAAGQQASLRI